MLHINNLTYRIGDRLLFDQSTAALPAGHKIGLVGRNGAGKTTLLKLALGQLQPENGTITVPSRARIGSVAQEAPGGATSLIDTVLAADVERSRLMDEAETAEDPNRISEIHLRLTDIDAHSAPARAATILAGLGFPEEQQARSCSELSGGWRMRVALAAALFAAPDVLLLDEPTNYLDLEGVIWLKSFLRGYRHTIVIISHDRDLLNEAVNTILHVKDGKLSVYQGNYDSFDRQRREQQALQLKMKRKQDDARRHIQDFVDRFRYTASKARQAQSRLKTLEKMQPVTGMVNERVAPFMFPNPQKPLNPPLVRFENASVGYNGKAVLRDLDLRIDDDDRIALLGSNGNGKSTFAKLLCGKLMPLEGHKRNHKRLEVGYFAQHQLDELETGQTPYDYFRELLPEATEAQRRARLGAYGFGATLASNKVDSLSGGEKARLLFALAAFHAPHILVLDEPTNHLDVEAREALVLALNDYQGAVILISHDRHLIEASADRLWLVNNGTVKSYDGDLDSYTDLVLGQSRESRRKANKKPAAKAKPVATKPQPVSGKAKKPLRKKIQETEAKIEKLQDKLAILDAALADPTLYADEPKKARDFASLRTKLAGQLETTESEWLTYQEALEQHGA